MTKFEPLTRFLRELNTAERRVSFAELEQILGFKLPPSARRHRPWWSNNDRNSVMTKAWLAAGFRTEQVDMAGETLVFRKIGASGGLENGLSARGKPLFGALKDTVHFAAGVDPTEPTGETWSAEQGRF